MSINEFLNSVKINRIVVRNSSIKLITIVYKLSGNEIHNVTSSTDYQIYKYGISNIIGTYNISFAIHFHDYLKTRCSL